MKNLDVNRLTMGELATIEKLSDQSIANLEDEHAPKGNLLAALAMVAKRRNGEPGFKWGDALALTLDEVTAILGLDDDETDEAPDAVETTVEHADADLTTLDAPAPKTTRRRTAADPS